MAAPCSIGRHKTGDASVLSTISGTPASCAIVASAARSDTTPTGLARLSTKMQRVLSVIAAATLAGTSVSTKLRSEEHTSELQSIKRNSYAVFRLKTKKTIKHKTNN